MKDAEHIGTVQQCHIYTSRIRTVEMHIGVRQGFEVLPAQVTHTTLVLHLAQPYQRNACPTANVDNRTGYMFTLGVVACLSPATHAFSSELAIVVRAVTCAIKKVLDIVRHNAKTIYLSQTNQHQHCNISPTSEHAVNSCLSAC